MSVPAMSSPSFLHERDAAAKSLVNDRNVPLLVGSPKGARRKSSTQDREVAVRGIGQFVLQSACIAMLFGHFQSESQKPGGGRSVVPSIV